jgi:maltose O-acetyltransferase
VAYEQVVIGDFAMIGELVSIRDANHGLTRGIQVKLQPHHARPISIGSDAWIGRGAYIGKGAQIGDGAVVGANSVVTRDVSPGDIVAGAPARIIGERPAKDRTQ